MRVRFSSFRRLRNWIGRVDQTRLDLILALVLVSVAELEVWAGNGVTGQRLAAALISALITASVALRRRYPFSVGAAVPAAYAIEIGFWSNLQIVAVAVAYLAALYGLTVWTPTRRFLAGVALILTADLAIAAGPRLSLRHRRLRRRDAGRGAARAPSRRRPRTAGAAGRTGA